MIEGKYFKTYKKANLRDETESIDLTQSEVKFGSKSKQFIIVYDKNEEFVFSCSNGKESNKWVEQIWNVQKSVIKVQEMENISSMDDEMEHDNNLYNIIMESMNDLDDPQPSNPTDDPIENE